MMICVFDCIYIEMFLWIIVKFKHPLKKLSKSFKRGSVELPLTLRAFHDINLANKFVEV